METQTLEAVVQEPAQTPDTSAQSQKNIQLVNRMNRQKMVEKLKKMKKVSVTISPMYRPYVGKVMPIQLNGVIVYVPADGQAYTVAEPFAAIWHERRRYIDTIMTKQESMADVPNNIEKRPGEITMF